MRPNTSRIVIVSLVLVTIGLLTHAGQLTPPAGPVAPTMKTLEEISTQISGLQAATGGAPIKRVVRGVIDLPLGQAEASQSFSPNVDPAKSVVTLSNLCLLDQPISSAGWASRSSVVLLNLTASGLTVRADPSINLSAGKVSFQIIEYN